MTHSPKEEHVVVVHGVDEVLHGVVVLQAGPRLTPPAACLQPSDTSNGSSMEMNWR